MAGRVIDLTFDDSSDENTVSKVSKPKISKSSSSQRQPLNPIQNNVHLPPISSLLPQTDLPAPLIEALHKASAKRVRGLLMKVCREHPDAKALVQRKFLVPKREVVPYHADSESENAEESPSEVEESDSESEAPTGYVASAAPSLKRKAEAVEDRELFPRFARCENCKEEFDVTENERGDCIWHPGQKEVYEDDDFWADHDNDCHGDPWDPRLMEDPDLEDGYKWDCCDKLGGEEGCMQTKHKTAGQPKKSKYT